MNTTKKYRLILVLLILIPINSFAFDQANEQQIYLGCYQNSKQYLGAAKAKAYCLCTIDKLSEKFSDDELDSIFKQKPEQIVKDTQFASKYCEKEIIK